MNSWKRLVLVSAGLLILTACGSDAEPGRTTTTADGGVTTTSAPTGAAGIHVADSDLGPILVDPDGFTLYVFTADSDGESACYDACADLWPPVPAETGLGPDVDASIFGSTTRTDGMEQLTVNGQPLYLYTPDVSPGDTTGQGFNAVWFVVDATGTMVGNAESGNDAGTVLTGGDDGLDY